MRENGVRFCVDFSVYIVFTFIVMIGGMAMIGTVQKWGNSNAVRLPKAILSAAFIQENDSVVFSVEENRIIITKVCRRHKTLKERLECAGDGYVFNEWDTGESLGMEIL